MCLAVIVGLAACDASPIDPTPARRAPTRASSTVTPPSGIFTWNAGSTVKVEQVLGDIDWERAAVWLAANPGATLPVPAPASVLTAGLTGSLFNVYGSDLGSSFDLGDSLVFLFGDTDTDSNPGNAVDVVGKSGATSGEQPLRLQFTMGGATGLEPGHITGGSHPMGAFNVPNAGIHVNGTTYVVANVNASVGAASPHATSESWVLQYNAGTGTFTDVRQLSATATGRFVYTALHSDTMANVPDRNVFIFGTGSYRASNIYLASVRADHFGYAAPTTKYFTGLDPVTGAPILSTLESDAMPIVFDNPLNTPGDTGTVGNISVAHPDGSPWWIMLYDGGRQSPDTRGIYFTYARKPWGPWATPQLIFHPVRDGAVHHFIHAPCQPWEPACVDDLLHGPVPGSNDPITTFGAAYAPMIIERFSRIQNQTLTLYYLVSTWNPYTVVKMKSTFTIAP
jgi:hypothetical protein